MVPQGNGAGSGGNPAGGSSGGAPPAKKQLSDFKIGKTLGEGAYSTVKRVDETATGITYALKVVNKQHMIKEDKSKWVHREKQAMSKLHHPNIVGLFYTFQDPSNLFFVLEFCPNGELLAKIKEGILHRDLKPENILLSSDNHLKIVDFGTAKEIGTDPRARSDSFCGTAEYLSPELLNEKHSGFPSDIWAVGCIIYQLLSGRPPFRGKVPLLIFQQITARELNFPDGFPPVGKPIVDAMLTSQPEHRLGCGAEGYNAIKAHPFFTGTDWNHLAETRPPPFASPASPIQWPQDPKPESPEEMQKRFEKEERQRKLDEQKKSVWAQFLQENELIVESGLVLKKKGLFSRKRQLIVTDKPRILYIDPEKMAYKGEIPWTPYINTEIKDDHRHFLIHTAAQRWADAINRLKGQPK